ncbi:MAG TPA: hypothetical protein VGN26_12510 [Armatimonadota bacterium]
MPLSPNDPTRAAADDPARPDAKALRDERAFAFAILVAALSLLGIGLSHLSHPRDGHR